MRLFQTNPCGAKNNPQAAAIPEQAGIRLQTFDAAFNRAKPYLKTDFRLRTDGGGKAAIVQTPQCGFRPQNPARRKIVSIQKGRLKPDSQVSDGL